jgi:ABC-type nickel/cobalt efflux system permease component RcnA
MRLPFLALMFGLLAAVPVATAQPNPFGVGQPAGAPAAEPAARVAPATPSDSPPSVVLPAPVRAVFRQVATWQRELNRFLSARLRESSQGGGAIAAATVLLVSFLYGVLHAAGPGHGKMVVASYFTARRAPLRTGILMGSVIAMTQAVVAIVMVWLMAIVLGGSQMQILERTTLLELASYAIICAIGLYMTYTALKGQDSCGHDHGPAASGFDGHAHDSHDHHGHEHHAHGHHSHGHTDHRHRDGHGDGDEEVAAARHTWLARTARRLLGRDGEVIAVGIVSGVRPCSGSILVLLFALANGVFLLGIAAAFSIAAGVAITISALGIGAIVLRRVVAGGETSATPARTLISRSLAVAGSLAVVVLGGLLFGGTLSQTGLI